MNQILSTKTFSKKKFNKKIFKFQFIFSIIVIIVTVYFIVSYFISIEKNEKISENLSGNYNIYKLYSNFSHDREIEDNIFGTIEIPKINVKYTVFSSLNDDLLKISPCKFYGKSPKDNGNICIAGHNYNNSKFFSNLFLLDINDEIYLFDNLENKYTYKVFDYYEVDSSNLSPVFEYTKSTKLLTLITCNNINQKRLIIKAKQI